MHALVHCAFRSSRPLLLLVHACPVILNISADEYIKVVPITALKCQKQLLLSVYYPRGIVPDGAMRGAMGPVGQAGPAGPALESDLSPPSSKNSVEESLTSNPRVNFPESWIWSDVILGYAATE